MEPVLPKITTPRTGSSLARLPVDAARYLCAMRVEIESLAAFDAHVASERTLRGCAVQDVDLTLRLDVLETLDVHNALFLGCRLSPAAADSLARRGALVFPRLPDVPFDAYRSGLYTADELYRGLERGYPATPDGRVYAWTRRSTSTLLDATLARALHDHAISDALAELHHDAASGVGIMGGHAVARGTERYLESARLGHRLAASGRLVVTGGGPGAMEAANLGASFGRPESDLDAACSALAEVPSFHRAVEGWARRAFEVRDAYDCTRLSVGVPTWFYGHEPPNVFASEIAKYFDNAVREDVLIGLCGAGIVFTEGAAGTVQEIFQATTRAYYADADAFVAPLVLVGRDYWTRVLPAWPLLAALGDGRRMAERIHLVDTIDEALGVLG